MKKKLVAIVMGSDSDLPIMQEAGKLLDEFNVGYDITVSSAHLNIFFVLAELDSSVPSQPSLWSG